MLKIIWLIILSSIISYTAYLSLQLDINNLQNSITKATSAIKKYNQQVIYTNNQIKEAQINLNNYLSRITSLHTQIKLTQDKLNHINTTLKDHQIHKTLTVLKNTYNKVKNLKSVLQSFNLSLKQTIKILHNNISYKKNIILPTKVQKIKKNFPTKSNINPTKPKIIPSIPKNIKIFQNKIINKHQNSPR